MESGIRYEARHVVFSGSTGSKRLFARRVEEGDADRVLELQQRVSGYMPDPDHMALMDREALMDAIRFDFGICLMNGDELVAYTQMVVNRSCEGNHGEHFGFPAEKCVTFDISFVDPAWRGLGIQKFFIQERERAAIELGAELGFVTVSPDNAPSLNNLVSQGFEVHLRGRFYGGRDRYLMKKVLG